MFQQRRDLIKLAGISALAGMGVLMPDSSSGQTQTAKAGQPFMLPALPYGYEALEPYIDAETMHFHHDKHHAAYVNNLNNAVANYPDVAAMSVEELVRHLDKVPEPIRTVVRNNGGGHANHSFFWQIMHNGGSDRPQGELAQAIDTKFGSFPGCQDQLTKAALSVFGSGWAWLSSDDKGGISIETTPNQDSPWMAGRTPLLGIDVWEHAYYLKYKNVRADYVAAFYKVISWDAVSERFHNIPVQKS